MDKTRMYRLMSEKAIEIQNDKAKYNIGSLYYAFETYNRYETTDNFTQHKNEYFLYYGLSGFSYSKHYHCDETCWQIYEGNTTKHLKDMIPIWLPTQDQLQDIYYTKAINERYATSKEVHLVLMMHSFIYDNANYIGQFESMEQLWLAFVMIKKYNKKWNGKDWVNDET